MKDKKFLVLTGLLWFGVLLAGCNALLTTESNEFIEASGVVEAEEIVVASEISGRVTEIVVRVGDVVKTGDILIVLENEMLDTQHAQALAALKAAQGNLAATEASLISAEVGLESARLGLELSRLQHESILRAVRLAELPSRAQSWNGDPPDEFELPSWYFDEDEEIRIAEAEVDNALTELEIEKANLEDVLNDVSNADIRAFEKRLAAAQFSFSLAQELIDREVEQNGEDSISDYLQSIFDSAEAELESAQAEYDSVLTEDGAQEVLDARARVVVADERYQLAHAKLYQLTSGDQSLEVVMAQVRVQQAETNVVQAEAALMQIQAVVSQAENLVDQAQANLDLIELQIEKLRIESQVDGVVLVKTIDEGELLQPGVTAIIIGQLDDLTITVYVPEDIYGKINLGDRAEVRVDSYEDRVFSAEVVRIADQAEYTPRNVQTEEDRKTTVFALELSVIDAEGMLKPGMPADVTFVN